MNVGTGTGPQQPARAEQPAALKQPKQRRKPGPSPKQRLPALQVPRDSPDSAPLDPLVKGEGTPSAHAPRKGRAAGANRGVRSVSRTPSRNLRWASSHLSSPSGGLGRRLRSVRLPFCLPCLLLLSVCSPYSGLFASESDGFDGQK